MTYGTLKDMAERMARVSPNAMTSATNSDITRIYLNEGQREFAKKVHGVATESRLSITPRFNVETNYAVRFYTQGSKNALASTNIYCTPSQLTNASGSSVASYLQAMLNTAVVAALGSGSITVNWSASSWQFYVNCGTTATSVYFGSPTGDLRMVDAADILGLNDTVATSTFTGAVPEDCSLRASLPTGFLEVQYVEWDKNQLAPAPFGYFMSPETTGTPEYYSIQNKEIRFSPTPEENAECVLRYKGAPSDASTDGTEDTTECRLPEEVHMAPVYYAAAMILEETHEPQQAVYFQQKFNTMCAEYRMRESNNTPTLFPQSAPAVPPKVTMDET